MSDKLIQETKATQVIEYQKPSSMNKIFGFMSGLTKSLNFFPKFNNTLIRNNEMFIVSDSAETGVFIELGDVSKELEELENKYNEMKLDMDNIQRFSENVYSIPVKRLLTTLMNIIKSCSKDPTKNVLMRIEFNCIGNKIELKGTNGYLLNILTLESENDQIPEDRQKNKKFYFRSDELFKIAISLEKYIEASSVLSTSNPEAFLYFMETSKESPLKQGVNQIRNHLVIELPTIRIITNDEINFTFPDTTKIMPKETDFSISVSHNELFEKLILISKQSINTDLNEKIKMSLILLNYLPDRLILKPVASIREKNHNLDKKTPEELQTMSNSACSDKFRKLYQERYGNKNLPNLIDEFNYEAGVKKQIDEFIDENTIEIFYNQEDNKLYELASEKLNRKQKEERKRSKDEIIKDFLSNPDLFLSKQINIWLLLDILSNIYTKDVIFSDSDKTLSPILILSGINQKPESKSLLMPVKD